MDKSVLECGRIDALLPAVWYNGGGKSAVTEMDERESALVEQAAAGNRAAIQQLLIRQHDRLVGTIEERVPADLHGVLAAEDVCQEAYIAVFQQITTLRDRSARGFRSWLLAIAERKLVDEIRAHRSQKRGGGRNRVTGAADAEVSSAVQLLDLVAIHERTPSQSVARGELIVGVRKALGDLKDEHRLALQLHYIEGLTVAETARRMDRSGHAVVMLCNRALRQLARAIGDPTRYLSGGT